MKKISILVGEGIECEKESRRFFNNFFDKSIDWAIAKILKDKGESFFAGLQPKDWVFIPGGFSFADHLGSGKLLSFYLNQIDFFNRIKNSNVTVMGVCNGFQVLAAAGVFGENFYLEHNKASQGFINRWAYCKSPVVSDRLKLCVRHGEGRIKLEGTLASHVKPILFYDDKFFDNGSADQMAGVVAEFESGTRVYGFMPHPEIAMRLLDDPDCIVGDYWSEQKHLLTDIQGDGVKLIEALSGLKARDLNSQMSEKVGS